MKDVKTKLIDFGADLLCCMLLGASICAAVLPYLKLETSIGAYLLLMAVDLTLIVLFSRRWWIFPAFCALAIVLVACGAFMFDVSDEVYAYVRGFFRWCAQGYPQTSPYSENGSITMVRLAAALPIAALSYLYYRKLFAFAVLPPASLALLLWLHAKGSAVLIPVLVLLLSVLLLAMAKLTGNRINRRLPESDRISSVLLKMFALILVPFILLFAFVFAPEKDGEWRSQALVYLVEDIGDAMDIRKNESSLPRTFDMNKAGFSPLLSRLGGDITLSDDIVMKVKTSMPQRLSGAVYDTYSGSMWSDAGGMGGYRVMSSLWKGKWREVFSMDKPYGGKRAKELYSKLTSPVSLDISYNLQGNTLFYAGVIQSLKGTNFNLYEFYFNRQAELTAKKVQRSLHYTLNTVVFNRDASGFDENMLALESAATSDKGFEEIKAYYLQLPKSLPNSVYAAAEEITTGCASPYEKAVAIERWLFKNCTYTLTPGEPPKDRDFVDYFLQTRKGYCVYYASAMTVLARCAGLPARYVTGYALKKDPLQDSPLSYVATNATAHAWTEIYFQGIGWLTFDATGWNFFEHAIVRVPAQSKPQTTKKPFIPQQTAIEEPETGKDGSKMPVGIRAAMLILLFLMIAFAGYAVIRVAMLLTDAEHSYRRLCHRYVNDGDRLDACYRKIVRQVEFFGVKQKTDDTIASFAARADRQLGTRELSVVCESVMRMRFALEEPAQADVKKLCAFSAALERRLRTDLGLSGYLWHRILLGR